MVAVLVAVIAMLSSCEKEDKAVDKPVQVTEQIPMGSNYDGQFFYKLSTNTIVSQNSRESWDLAFQASADGYHVFLNSSKLMYAYNTGSTSFDATYTYSQARNRWDQPSGNADSTAIGEWGTLSNGNVTSFNQVYLVDRGKTSANVALEKRKVVFKGLTNDTYTIEFANLDGTDSHVVDVKKDNNYNLVYLSFDNGGSQVQVEPTKDAWDLEFTQYTHIFYESPVNIPYPTDTLPYSVNGVLLNQNGVSVSKDTFNDIAFDSVTINDATTRTYSTRKDAIGWDWKTFQFDDENYTINQYYKYYIKTADGKYYKLRFTDFYDSTGVKGYPTFQYEELK